MAETNKIYVDIESLLDLRQGLLFEVVEDKETLADYIVSDDYNYREIDSFPHVTDDVYKKAYSTISKSVLPASALTHIIAPVRNKVLTMEKTTGMSLENKRVEIILNVAPLDLTYEEKDYIRNLLFIKLQTECIITVVELSVKKLSPAYLKQNSFKAAFIYDFTGWVNAHTSQLELVDIKEVPLYFPALQQRLPTKEELKKVKEVGFSDMFSYTEFLFSRVINVNFLPIVFYSNLITTAVYLKEFNKELLKETFEEVDLTGVDLPDV